MEYYFDTSSLVALARYYHPFDKDGRLFEFVRSKFQNKEIIVLDAILNEAKLTSKGIALKAYPFIEEQKDLIVDTKELMPYSTKKFGNMVDMNFAVAALMNKIYAVVLCVYVYFVLKNQATGGPVLDS